MKSHVMIATAALLALAGCSTISQGTRQGIFVQTTPAGAHCDLVRKGKHIATLNATPGIASISRTKDYILLTCALAGYQDTSQILPSGIAKTTLGNVLIGGVIGWGIDSAHGADNEYSYGVNLEMLPLEGTSSMKPGRLSRPRCIRRTHCHFYIALCEAFASLGR